MYFKIGEYNSAINWFSSFLEVQDSHADAHKMLGLCYEKLKKPDRALQAYHRSLQLDPKQINLITDGKCLLLGSFIFYLESLCQVAVKNFLFQCVN